MMVVIVDMQDRMLDAEDIILKTLHIADRFTDQSKKINLNINRKKLLHMKESARASLCLSLNFVESPSLLLRINF